MPTGFYKRSESQIQKLKEIGFVKNDPRRYSFAVGNTIRRGVKMSPEQCKRISDGHKGLKKSEETKNKIRMAQIGKPRLYAKGENNWNWNGGATKPNEKIRKSLEYVSWRRDIFIRDSFTCQKCGNSHVYLEAHHIKSFAKHPEYRFDKDNGLTLCKECHKQTDNYGKKARIRT